MQDGNSQQQWSEMRKVLNGQPSSIQPSQSHQNQHQQSTRTCVLFSIVVLLLSFFMYHYFQSQIEELQQAVQKQRNRGKFLANDRMRIVEERLSKVTRNYLTPELEEISERRVQKEGNIPTTPGDVTELEYFKKNALKTIDQYLYDEGERISRIKYLQARRKFLKGATNYESLPLIKHNLLINDSDLLEQTLEEHQEYERLDQFYHFQRYKNELPICAVIAGYNNNDQFRIQLNLNSIFRQNYTNYFVVIINDASTDGSDEIYRKYLRYFKINKDKYVYIENKLRKTTLENIYHATHQYCSIDSIVANIDGDDQLIGSNVFKIYNAEYQRTHAGVLYSSYHEYQQGSRIFTISATEYTRYQKQNHLYRKIVRRFAQLRTFRAQLFRMIKAKDLQDSQGEFFKIAYDQVFYFKVIELSCGRVHVVPGYHYLYKTNTGLNDYDIDPEKQLMVDKIARSSNFYNCSEEFEKKMRAEQQ